MIIKESAENYLETIFIIIKEKGFCKSIDIATKLGFSKPSVSIAMKNFREEGYITVEENGYINLSSKGLKIAENIFERHEIIAKLLISLGVDDKTAYDDSCKIEHNISEKSFLKLKEYIEKIKK